jgi:predicted nuclease of restriction endonuclease-like RecB superfamily
LLPRNLLSITPGETHFQPGFLGDRDLPWVRAVLARADAYVGRTSAERDDCLPGEAIEIARPLGASQRAIEGLLHVLLRLHPTRVCAAVSPIDVRRVTFTEAAAGPSFDGPRALERASERLGIPAHEVLRALFADRACERIVFSSAKAGPIEAIEAYNLALVEGLAKVSEEVVVPAAGHVEEVLSFVRRTGLLCVFGRDRLHVSGPLSILRHTAKYGHRLATFFPSLLTRGLTLELACVMQRARVLVKVERPERFPHLPFPSKKPSGIERALAADLEPLGWSLTEVAGELRLRHASVDLPIEILSFHTPEYVRTKLASGPRIICVDETLACRDGPLPNTVLRYRKRIDAHALVSMASAQGQAMPTLDLVGVP